MAEAAKSCFLRRDCCLWFWPVSLGLRRRQQNLDSEALLLPLHLAGFIESMEEAEAAKFLVDKINSLL
jgi:hypothetical protein